MTGSVVDLSRTAAPVAKTCDVLVVGSGCGGATAARVLAESGREVVVLEEGTDLTGGALTQRDGAMYDQLYMDRGGRATDDLAISIMQGRALGGGGVINMCDVVPIPDGVLAHWARRCGLTDLTPERLAPYRALALEDLSARPIEEREVNRANQLLREGATSLGWRGALMWHNRIGCVGLGTCLLGCPAGAKQNPRFVSVPRAVEAGAVFYTRARAVRVSSADREIKTVRVEHLDPAGHRVRGAFEIRAQTVIVAANGVATPQLLLRSGIGNAHMGRHLSLQPQLPVVALFDEQVDAYLGIPQAYAVTEFEQEDHADHGLWGFRLEPVMGTPGIVASLMPFVGYENLDLMQRYRNIAACLVLTPDDNPGRVSLHASGRPRVEYPLSDEHKARLREGATAAARAYLAAGARRVLIPVSPPVVVDSERACARIGAMDLRPATAPLISAHQQGAVRMAPSEAAGAADPAGRVYGARGVFVLDSSGFPTSASSHTMAPIITVSRYLAAALAAEGGG